MMDLVEMVLKPQLVVMTLAAVAAFATVFTIAIPLLARDQMTKRMRIMATERDRMRAARLADLKSKEGQGKLRQAPKGFIQQVVDQFNLRQLFDTEELRNTLKMAGYRGSSAIYTYAFFRIAMPLIVTLVALIYLFVLARNMPYPPIMKFLMALGCGFLGYYLPNMFLQNIVQRRQQSIKDAFPDALDMLLICVQAGMSIEASFAKVSKEVGSQSLELAEEFSLTTAELSYLSDRRGAFENLGKRTGIAGIKAVATALIQAERYGTPVGQALRVMAKENRDMRMLEAEKKAAALPPKLTVPMIVFFLPVLFIVILGPAVIQVMKLS
jgi:tight adherence protein C